MRRISSGKRIELTARDIELFVAGRPTQAVEVRVAAQAKTSLAV